MKRFLFLGFAVLLSAGCGGAGQTTSDDAVLATVGAETITGGEFWDSIRRMKPEDRPALDTPESRQAFLTDLINKQLLESASYEVFPELLPTHEKRVKRYGDMRLSAALTDHLIRSQVHITEADKDLLYENRQRDIDLEAIQVPTEEMAEAMVARLNRGAVFEDLAAEYSIMEYDDPLHPGVVGWVTSGTYAWEMEKALWGANPGDILGPLKGRNNDEWFLCRVGESRSVPPETTRENMDQDLEYRLTEQAFLARQKVVQDSLHAAANPVYTPEGEALMMFKYYWEPTTDNPTEYLDAARVAPTYTAAEETVTVIRFDKFPDWTAEYFTSERLKLVPSGLWPRGATLDQLHDVYKQQVREYLIIQAAKDYGLDKTPDYIEQMNRREREMRVRYLYRQVVIADVLPTNEEILAWFEENRDRYKSAPQYRVAHFASSQRDVIDGIREEWLAGEKFTDIRDKYASQDPELESSGDSPFISEGQDVALDDHIAPLEEGSLSEVFARADKYFVFKLNARREPRLVTYEEAKEFVDKDVKTIYEERALVKYLDEQRVKFPVTITEGAVEGLSVPEDLAALAVSTS